MALVSVIIPVKNGEATLAKCLSAIRQQTVADKIEIIVLDSMSIDNSRNIAISYGAKIIEIPNGTFNHGLTRNFGVQNASEDLLYFTVQDAYLAENDQLERMANHFKDKEVKSVTGIQGIPSDLDKNPAIWFSRFTKPVPEVRQFKEDSFQNLSGKQKLESSRSDNVNTMYRKSALKILPFRKTDFAEDILWSYDALGLGWKLMHDPSLLVYHYHHQTFNYAFKTSYILNYVVWKYFGMLPVMPALITPLAKNVYAIFRKRQLSILKKIQWVLHNTIRHSADLVSFITFRLIHFIGKQKGLERSYKYFCSAVPQGEQKNSFNNILR